MTQNSTDKRPTPANMAQDRSSRKEAYHEFLKSDAWYKIRRSVLQRDGFTCQKCGYQRKLQVHHMRYARNIQDTPTEWMVTLCRRCHKAIHRLVKADRKKDRQPKATGKRSGRIPGPRIRPRRITKKCSSTDAESIDHVLALIASA